MVHTQAFDSQELPDLAGYALALYFFVLTLRTMSVGVAYAIWAGVGMALIALIGWFVVDQPLEGADSQARKADRRG